MRERTGQLMLLLHTKLAPTHCNGINITRLKLSQYTSLFPRRKLGLSPLFLSQTTELFSFTTTGIGFKNDAAPYHRLLKGRAKG